MLPRDVVGLTVPREAVTISGWAPYVQLQAVPDAAEPEPQNRCHRSTLERGVAAIARAGSALRRAA